MFRIFVGLLVAFAVMVSAESAQATDIPQTMPVLLKSSGSTAVPSKTGYTSILFVGDSLTAGITKIAPGYFPGWKVGINGLGGRPLNDGMSILASYKMPARTILAMGLFTNDLPTRVWALKQAVRESLRRVGSKGCVIWSTIKRPSVGGPSWQGALPGDAVARKAYPAAAVGIGYAKANAALRQLAAENPNMRLVDWAGSLRRHPMKMDFTQVHPGTISGWQRRAQLYANAARSC